MKAFSSVGLAVAVTLLAAGPVVAQESDALEEVVVTATKREQTLQDISVAVTVTSAETLERAQIRNLSDLQSVVPSLRVTTAQTSIQTTFLIRGFGNGANNPGIEPAVGVFVDGVYRSRSAGAIGDLVDVQRVEVLRGPQSTLFGQNTTAGVISVVTQKPSLTEASGFIEASLGNYNERILRSRYSGPISDTVAVSLTSSVNKRDGYFKVLPIGNIGESDINNRDRADVRGQLLWKPSDQLEVRLIGDFSRVNEQCCGVSNVIDGSTGNVIRGVGGLIYSQRPFDRSAYLNRLPENEVNNSGLSLHADWKSGDFVVSAILARRKQDYDFTYDFDFTSARLGGTNRNVSDTQTDTQELRVAYDAGGAFRALAGVYRLDEDVDYGNFILFGQDARNYAATLAAASQLAPLNLAPAAFAAALPGATAQILGTFSTLEAATGSGANSFFANNSGNRISNTQANSSWTAFSQFDLDFAEDWTLTAGVARTNSKKDINYQSDSGEPFARLNLVQIGFGSLFTAFTDPDGAAGPLAGLAPTPANFALVPAAAQLADLRSVIACAPGAAPGSCNQLLGFYPLQFLAPVVGFADSSDDSKTTYTVKLSHDVNDNVRVYGSMATGFKATSWNLSRDSKPVAPATAARSPLGGAVNPWYPRYGSRKAAPEEATSYELGLKGQWDRSSINVAVFDTEITGFQENTFRGTGFVLSNAGKQSSRGIEIESKFRIGSNWTAEFAGTFLQPKYDSYVGAPSPCSSGISSVDRSGQRPFGVHGRSLSTALTYAWQSGDIDGFVRADYQYESNTLISTLETSASNCNVSPPTNTVDFYRQVRSVTASAGITKGDWSIMVWGRNLTNDNYLTAVFPGVAQQGSTSGYPNEPRTYGITVRRNFGSN